SPICRGTEPARGDRRRATFLETAEHRPSRRPTSDHRAMTNGADPLPAAALPGCCAGEGPARPGPESPGRNASPKDRRPEDAICPPVPAAGTDAPARSNHYAPFDRSLPYRRAPNFGRIHNPRISARKIAIPFAPGGPLTRNRRPPAHGPGIPG